MIQRKECRSDFLPWIVVVIPENIFIITSPSGFPCGTSSEEPACHWRDAGLIPGSHSSIRAWRIPWTEEPGRLLWSIGSQTVGHDWSNLSTTGSNYVSQTHTQGLSANALPESSTFCILFVTSWTRTDSHIVSK